MTMSAIIVVLSVACFGLLVWALAERKDNARWVAWARKKSERSAALLERIRELSKDQDPAIHIEKIEITVSGNEEQNRVAKLVVDRLNAAAAPKTPTQ